MIDFSFCLFGILINPSDGFNSKTHFRAHLLWHAFYTLLKNSFFVMKMKIDVPPSFLAFFFFREHRTTNARTNLNIQFNKMFALNENDSDGTESIRDL